MGGNTFPAYRARLDFGENQGKHADVFLAVEPGMNLSERSTVYFYEDSGVACVSEVLPINAEGASGAQDPASIHGDHLSHAFKGPEDNKFFIVQLKDSRLLLRPGEDKTDRLLLFFGYDAPLRSKVSVFDPETKGVKILAKAEAGNEKNSAIEMAILFDEKGGQFALRTSSATRDRDIIEIWSWTSKCRDIQPKPNSRCTFQEWDYKRTLALQLALGGTVL
jgi:hypothetical protein